MKIILLSILYFFPIITLLSQNNNSYKFQVENFDLKKGSPLFDHKDRIIGRLHRIIKETKKNAYVDFNGSLKCKYKIHTFSGKEIILDLLPTKTIFIEKTGRIINYGSAIGGNCEPNSLQDYLVYDTLGNVLIHLEKRDRLASDLIVPPSGEIYIFDQKGLIKINLDGSYLEFKYPEEIMHRTKIISTLSLKGDKIAVAYKVNDLLQIHIFNTSGTLLKTFPVRGFSLGEIFFWKQNKIINFSNFPDGNNFMFTLLDFNKKDLKKEFISFKEKLSLKGKCKLLGVNAEKEFFVINLKKTNEIIVIKYSNDQFKIINRFELGTDLLNNLESAIILKDKIELFTLKKKITLILN